MSAGQYGMALNQLVFSVDPADRCGAGQDAGAVEPGGVVAPRTATPPATPVWTASYPSRLRTTAAIRGRCGAQGGLKLGALSAGADRWSVLPRQADDSGNREPRCRVDAGQPWSRRFRRWATRNPESGATQIAFMNPGGLRDDMVGEGTGAIPADADLQAGGRGPAVRQHVGQHGPDRCAGSRRSLEQQWQAAGCLAAVPEGWACSKGFTYTFDDTQPRRQFADHRGCGWTAPRSSRQPLYSVTVDSFLALWWRRLLRAEQRCGQAGHRKDRPGGDGRLHGGVRRHPARTWSRWTASRTGGRGQPSADGEPESYAPGDHVKFGASRRGR